MSEKLNGLSKNKVNKYTNQNKMAPSTTIMKNKMPSKGILRKQDTNKVTKEEIPPEETTLDATLSKSIEDIFFFKPVREAETKEAIKTDKDWKDYRRGTKKVTVTASNEKDEDSSNSSIDLDESEIFPTKVNNDNLNYLGAAVNGISLKDYPNHCRMMEERNKKKNEIVDKAIEQYSLKTVNQVRKVEEINSNLTKLDADLDKDVETLRNQIDMAFKNFTILEKQYIKCEAQFLKASKISLSIDDEQKLPLEKKASFKP